MYHSFFGERDRAVIAYGGAGLLLLVLFLQVQTAVAFAEIMHEFGNLVQYPGASTESFMNAMGRLALVHFLFFVYETALNYLSRRYVWHWRKAITLDYMRRWNPQAGSLEGASQRLTDAVNNFTLLALTMSMPVARALMVVFAFMPMLWEVSKEFEVRVFGHEIPGILLWAAVSFSGIGALISWLVGAVLPRLEGQVQIHEARFRTELEAVQWGDHSHQAEGPQDLVPAKIVFAANMNRSYRRLHNYLFGFDVWFGLYKQAWGFLPVFLLGLFVISGASSYGAMMQAMAALNEANQSLSVFSSLMTTFTKFQSYAQRLAELEAKLEPPRRSASRSGRTKVVAS